MKQCDYCTAPLSRRSQVKFCSNKCQFAFQHHIWIQAWKKGERRGDRGIITKNISGHLKKYFLEKFENSCSQCGWKKKHPVTGVIPLEIDHIDGNSENNDENNLRLLCPNCYALTPFYKNLNRGRGRKWRMEKYIKKQ